MSTSTLSELERLLIESACRTAVLKAAQAADAADHERLALLFTEDAQLRRPGGDVLNGREAIGAAYRSRPAERITRHLVTSTQVDVVSSRRATAFSRVLLWTGSTTDEAGPFGRRAAQKQVLGAFEDEFTRTADGWLISQRHAQFELYYEPV